MPLYTRGSSTPSVLPILAAVGASPVSRSVWMTVARTCRSNASTTGSPDTSPAMVLTMYSTAFVFELPSERYSLICA